MLDLLVHRDQACAPAKLGSLGPTSISLFCWVESPYAKGHGLLSSSTEQQPIKAVFSAAAEGRSEDLQDALEHLSFQESMGLVTSEAAVRKAALDLAVHCKQLACARVLLQALDRLSCSFLLAAVDSGSSEVLRWALQAWCSQFNCLHSFGPSDLEDLHATLRAACQLGDAAAVDLLLSCLHGVRSFRSCAPALRCACAAEDAGLVRHLLASHHLKTELERPGSSYLLDLAECVAQCLALAARRADAGLAECVLVAMTATEGCLAPVKPLLGPHMQQLFEQVALSGAGHILQQLLVQLPEYYDSFNLSALLAALSAGHTQLATTIRWLLGMRAEEFAPGELQPAGSPAVVAAELSGQLAQAIAAEDVPWVRQLLAGGLQALPQHYRTARLQQAVRTGSEQLVQLLLAGQDGSCLEEGVEVAFATAVESGQQLLLQELLLEHGGLQQRLRGSAFLLPQCLISSLLAGHTDLACWLLSQSLQPWLVLNCALTCLLAQQRGSLAKACGAAAGQGCAHHPLRQLLLAAGEVQPVQQLQQLGLEPEVLLGLVGLVGSDAELLGLLAEGLQGPNTSSSRLLASPRIGVGADAVALVHF